MLHQLVHTWFSWVQDWGYVGVILLMAMESSILPVPSEVVMPPAAFMAAQGELNLALVILAGTFGSWVGSSIMYALSRYLGRPAVQRWGKYVFIPPEKLERAERFLERYRSGGIFFARLLPVVRHLISIPAGILRMPFGTFSLMTITGSALWCTILSWFGKTMAERNPGLMADPEKLMAAIKHESVWLVGAIAAVGVLYFVMLRLTARRTTAAA